MTAIAAPPIDSIVSQPARQKMYVAKREECVLVYKQEYPVRGPSGEQVDIRPGIRIQFNGGMLRVPLEGMIKSQQGREVDAAEIIAWLDRHPLNGSVDEGFREVAQTAPPVTDSELEAIMEAGYTHDIDRLEAIVESERAGWGRAQIVGAVEKALSRIRAMHEQMEAQRAQEEAEAKKAKGAAK